MDEALNKKTQANSPGKIDTPEIVNQVDKEKEYILKINKLQQEIDEDEDLLEQAFNKIKELELRLSLSEGCTGKKKIPQSKIKEYENEITKLQGIVDMFSVEQLEHKKDELESYLKSIIKIKKDLEKLKNTKHHRDSQIEDIETAISGLNSDLVKRYIELSNTIYNIRKLSDGQLNTEYENLLSLFDTVQEILIQRSRDIERLTREVNHLKNMVTDYASSGETFETLTNKLNNKDMEIAALKKKINALEFELSRKES